MWQLQWLAPLCFVIRLQTHSSKYVLYFPEVWESERFQTAEMTFKVIQDHWYNWCHPTGHIQTYTGTLWVKTQPLPITSPSLDRFPKLFHSRFNSKFAVQVLSSSSDGRLFCHNKHGPKTGGLYPPFFGGGSWVLVYHNVAWAEAYHRTKWHLDPSSRLATIDHRCRQTDRTTVR